MARSDEIVAQPRALGELHLVEHLAEGRRRSAKVGEGGRRWAKVGEGRRRWAMAGEGGRWQVRVRGRVRARVRVRVGARARAGPCAACLELQRGRQRTHDLGVEIGGGGHEDRSERRAVHLRGGCAGSVVTREVWLRGGGYVRRWLRGAVATRGGGYAGGALTCDAVEPAGTAPAAARLRAARSISRESDGPSPPPAPSPPASL